MADIKKISIAGTQYDVKDANALHTDKISNCITEIPQDINLTLSNGTLTLKSGSIVTFADGSQYQLTSDKTRSSGANGPSVLVYRKTSGQLLDLILTQCVSGPTQPSIGNYVIWYDTTNNIIKYTSNNFSTWEEVSFPIALITLTSNVPTSIDQVFNGMGYIGSTVFALPGLKGLIPNGRNSDGTLKSTEFNYLEPKTYTYNGGNNNFYFACYSNSIDIFGINANRYYDEEINYIKKDGNNASWMIAGVVQYTSNNISSLTIKQPFHAVDYYDFELAKTDYYGTCDTAASTQQKDVFCEGFKLKKGVSVRVRFANNQNYNGNPTLNVNNTGAISIKRYGTTNAGYNEWNSGQVVSFTYDGTYWIIEDGMYATTTYGGKVVLSSSATSTTTGGYAPTLSSINSLVQNMIEPYNVYSSSSTYAVGDRVRYGYKAWKCKTAITSGESWNESHWEALPSVQEQLDAKSPAGNYVTVDTTQTITGAKTFNGNSVTITSDVFGSSGGHGIKLGSGVDNTKYSLVNQYLTSDNIYWTRILNHSYNKDAYIDIRIDENANRKISLSQTDTAVVVQPTEDTTSSSQIDTVGARNTKLQSYQTIANLETSLSTSDTKYPSSNAVKSAIDTAISSVYKPAGSIAFANLPTPASTNLGNVYNMTEDFTTDNRFVEGAGKSYPTGTNVVIIDVGSSTYKFDVLAGFIDLSPYALDANVVHKSGNETINGEKTFTSTVKKYTNSDSTIAPSTYYESPIIQNNDKNGILNTSLRTGYRANGNIVAALYAGNNGTNNWIGIEVSPSGIGTTRAPTPTETSSTGSEQIATVGWVNNPSTSTNVVHRTGAETIAGVKTFSDNMNANGTITVGQHATLSYNSSTEALDFIFT